MSQEATTSFISFSYLLIRQKTSLSLLYLRLYINNVRLHLIHRFYEELLTS